ncbi:uncharacterized protein MONOS_839 [Monocercomonoides exilis]|uniref:uncharacterized protein n=1 Tax=Monocercomonoides exilis TaxID=2049356 RepID=UPI00355A8EDD|nr:hypothetical protein MONOS_839 [Monocercomonoides exilis]|eukprot:MONOS_839.1-p1 / transcript=MONOS_839.1 / gene=MONOS_839 / organism=Monocercomonoides_exilis_PA203 / gene_product=unspecified product / transcript_product=unspecified product / location=Mono_scaffold00014:40493-41473(+) / protein_length=327 / sequence_SO=supercontig / SO=protein_coding / is_pseudo=false
MSDSSTIISSNNITNSQIHNSDMRLREIHPSPSSKKMKTPLIRFPIMLMRYIPWQGEKKSGQTAEDEWFGVTQRVKTETSLIPASGDSSLLQTIGTASSSSLARKTAEFYRHLSSSFQNLFPALFVINRIDDENSESTMTDLQPGFPSSFATELNEDSKFTSSTNSSDESFTSSFIHPLPTSTPSPLPFSSSSSSIPAESTSLSPNISFHSSFHSQIQPHFDSYSYCLMNYQYPDSPIKVVPFGPPVGSLLLCLDAVLKSTTSLTPAGISDLMNYLGLCKSGSLEIANTTIDDGKNIQRQKALQKLLSDLQSSNLQPRGSFKDDYK